MNPAGFLADMKSGSRILAHALPETRLEAFTQFSREGIRWHEVGGLPKSQVIDGLRDLGIEAGLSDGDIQAALANAVENPFVPKPPVSSSSLYTPRAPSPSASSQDRLVIRRASEITPQPIKWLWPGRMALGKVTIVAGEPGLGKSQLTCAITATVTKGGRWPNEEGVSPTGSVIILSAEDDCADTIRPRLDAAGADAAKVLIVSAVQTSDGKGRRSFNLQADLTALEHEIDRAGDVLLVVIDPVSSYLGKVDSHRNAELRAVLEPLGEMAARLGVAVIAVTHLNKSGAGSPNNRFIGSIAFVAAARAAFVVVRDGDDPERRLLLPTKNNVGPEGHGVAFRIGLMETPGGIIAPMVIWDGIASVTAEEALASHSGKTAPASSQRDAETFLRELLGDGVMPTRRIKSEATDAGLSWATIRRAKDALGINASKTALDGGWVWSLPKN